MSKSSGWGEVDFIEELRLRRWARENYVSQSQRQNGWHPVVLEEMHRKDKELQDAQARNPIYGTCA
jgi:hypothetical protein